MTHGGRRPGAGRKPKTNTEIRALRDLVAAKFDSTGWDAITTKLYREALKGNLRAVELLVSYRFGDPYAAPPVSQQDPPHVLVFEDAPSREDVPAS